MAFAELNVAYNQRTITVHPLPLPPPPRLPRPQPTPTTTTPTSQQQKFKNFEVKIIVLTTAVTARMASCCDIPKVELDKFLSKLSVL